MAQARAVGMPEDQIEHMAADMAAHWGKPSGDFAVHPANGPALKLFIAMASQWKSVALSTSQKAQVVRTGLDYGVVESTARLAGLDEVDPDTFQRLRVLEAEALGAWREDRERAA